jgi:hypothetical protein
VYELILLALVQLAVLTFPLLVGPRTTSPGWRRRTAVATALVALDLTVVAVPAPWAPPVSEAAIVLVNVAFLVVVGLTAMHVSLRRTPAPVRRALLLSGGLPGSAALPDALAKLGDAGLITRSAVVDSASTAWADALRIFRPDILLVDDTVAVRLPELLAEVTDPSTVTVLRVPRTEALRPSPPTLALADAYPVRAA